MKDTNKMNNNLPLVSIVIVNYNGKAHLEKCLPALMENKYEKYEVILVDNNSIDSSIEFVKNRYPSINVIELEKNLGFAEPNNLGAKKANGDFLLFLNNDTIPTSNFITELVKVAKENSDIAICQSLLLKPDGTIDSSGDFVDIYGRAYSSREKINTVRQILSARGASMMIRKDRFLEFGGFDKNFFASFEDVDLGLRAWIWGYKVVLVPSSVVYHLGGQTIQKLSSEVSFHGVKNTLLLRLTNFESSFVIRSIITLFFVSTMRKIFGVSVIKDPEQSPPLPSFKVIFSGLLWIISNFRYVKNKRKMINSKRVRSTKELIKMGLITR